MNETAPPADPLRIDPAAIDPHAAKIVHRLCDHGYRAYLVGGCVRDLLLGQTPKDFDLATSARPRQVKRLFRNSRIIGRRFRLVHIHFGDHVIEVATFRAPPEQEDESDLYIRRDNVFGNEKQDAFRRDFTINGLFYDLRANRVIDHVGGLDDLRDKTIRTIGDAEVRLREDPVRLLRAAKFAGRLGFRLADDLRAACLAHCRDLEKAAPPRVLEEIYRLLSNRGSGRAFALLEELGALGVILPELVPLEDRFLQSLRRLEEATGGARNTLPQSILLAVLFWPVVRARLADAGAGDCEAIADELLRPLAERLTIARRDSSRARQSLAAQARLAAGAHGPGARRFCLRESFAETMEVRRLVGPLVEDEPPDVLLQWEELQHRAHAQGEGPKRRKRRRRRRGKRRSLSPGDSGGTHDASPPPSESSSAPAPPAPSTE